MRKKLLAILFISIFLIGCNESKEPEKYDLSKEKPSSYHNVVIKDDYFNGKNSEGSDITSSYDLAVFGEFKDGKFKSESLGETFENSLKSVNDISLSYALDTNVKNDSYRIATTDTIFVDPKYTVFEVYKSEILPFVDGYPSKEIPPFEIDYRVMDTQSGKIVKLGDLIKDKDKFLNSAESLSADLKNALDKDMDAVNYSIDPFGLKFSLNEKSYRMDFKDSDFFKEGIDPDGSNFMLNLGKEPISKLNLGGKEFSFQVKRDQNQDYVYDITYGDSKVSSDETMPLYNIVSYLVALDKKYFLIVDSKTDSDFHITNVYSLADTVQKTDKSDFGFFLQRPIDPNMFKMQIRTALLSTYNVYGDFMVDSKGKLVLKDKYLYAVDKINLSLKKELDLKLVDENGEEKEDVKMPKGSKFTIYRTDNVDKVDLLGEDGKIYRLKLEVEEDVYPNTINGGNIEDYFDGTVFVG